jgi:hypothetical protein
VDYGRLSLDEQLAGLRALLTRSPTLVKVLTRAAVLTLPDWYLVAGCLYQTVWNILTGQPPESGILDYDLAYFDGSDLSWTAEDAVIQEGRRLFGDLPAPVQTPLPRRRSAHSRPPPPALACALSPARTGASTPRTGLRTCSTSSPAPTRCWHHATSTRPRSPDGGSNGHL